MLGKEAALFMPSGTQSNLCALMAIASAATNTSSARSRTPTARKAGGAAVLGSIQPQPLAHQADGTLALADIEAAIKPDDAHFATHAAAGAGEHLGRQGAAAGLHATQATALARRRGLATHLDGARLFNAAVALGG